MTNEYFYVIRTRIGGKMVPEKKKKTDNSFITISVLFMVKKNHQRKFIITRKCIYLFFFNIFILNYYF